MSVYNKSGVDWINPYYDPSKSLLKCDNDARRTTAEAFINDFYPETVDVYLTGLGICRPCKMTAVPLDSIDCECD